MSVMIIYYGKLHIYYQWIRAMIIKRQPDLQNTKESVLPVCNKISTRAKENGEEMGDM